MNMFAEVPTTASEMLDSEMQSAIESVILQWGWHHPPQFIKDDASLAATIKRDSLAAAVVSHGLLTQEQVSKWLAEATDPTTPPIEILSARSSRIRNSYDRLLSLERGLQYLPDLMDEHIELHPYLRGEDLQGKPLRDKRIATDIKTALAPFDAALILIQQKTTCIVFPDLENSLERFESLAGPERRKNAVLKEFGDSFVLAVSTMQQTQMRMSNDGSAPGTESASQSLRVVYKHKLVDDPDRRKLSLLHELAIAKNASDIHIDPDLSSGRINVTHRVWGEMERMATTLDATEYGYIKQYLLQQSGASIKFEMIREPKDGMYQYKGDKKSVYVRVSFIPYGTMDNNNPLSICLRHIPVESGRVDLVEKQVHPITIAALRDALTPDAGMVLVVGPTGSGKSTTVSGSIGLHQELHADRKTRFSIEDPVERYLPGIVQFQVPYHLRGQSLGFTGILRNLLRHDPNMIWVGEIRDADTAEISTQAAATGHLLISTLHADSAVDAVDRLSNLIPPANQSLRKALVKICR